MKIGIPPKHKRVFWFDTQNRYTMDLQPTNDRVENIRDVDDPAIELTSPTFVSSPRFGCFVDYPFTSDTMGGSRSFLQFNSDVMSSGTLSPFPLLAWPFTAYFLMANQNDPTGPHGGTYIFLGNSANQANQIAFRTDSGSNKGMGVQIRSNASGVQDSIVIGSNQGGQQTLGFSKCFQIIRIIVGLNAIRVYVNGIMVKDFLYPPPQFPLGLDHISFGQKTDPTPSGSVDYLNGFGEFLLYSDEHSDFEATTIEGTYLARKWDVPYGRLSRGWSTFPNL